MDISFVEIREKEVINIYDGKKLGHIIDIIFDKDSGQVQGVVVPGIRKFMRKTEDIFVPINNLKKIGEDVLLVKLTPFEKVEESLKPQDRQPDTYVRYRRAVDKEKP